MKKIATDINQSKKLIKLGLDAKTADMHYWRGSKVMATIKSFTDLPQSKKLAEILPIESADMTYYACVKDWRGNPVEPKWGKPATLTKEELALPCSNFQEYEYIPCWSLAALLSVLPRVDIEKEICSDDTYDYRVEAYIGDGYIGNWYDSPIDACYKMILMLHELKML